MDNKNGCIRQMQRNTYTEYATTTLQMQPPECTYTVTGVRYLGYLRAAKETAEGEIAFVKWA